MSPDHIKALGILDAIYAIPLVDKRWEDRPNSNIVKWMIENTGTPTVKVLSYLGCSKEYFNNKLQRNSFSVSDLILVSSACGYDVSFISQEGYNTRKIDPEVYFSVSNKAALERISDYNKIFLKQKENEYKELKIKLEDMKERYGFE